MSLDATGSNINSSLPPPMSATQDDIATHHLETPPRETPKPFSQQDLTAFFTELSAITSHAEKGLRKWTSIGGTRDTEAIRAVVNAARVLADADAKVWKDIYQRKANGVETELSVNVGRLEGLISGIEISSEKEGEEPEGKKLEVDTQNEREAVNGGKEGEEEGEDYNNYSRGVSGNTKSADLKTWKFRTYQKSEPR